MLPGVVGGLPRNGLLLAVLCGCLWGAAAAAAAVEQPAGPWPCAPMEQLPLEGLNLTAREQELLEDICWPAEGEPPRVLGVSSSGVPAGVNCTVIEWCDSGDVCTEVCAPGSVTLEPWLANAVRQQARLVQSLPLCYTTLLGTHNSAITLADGYGNLDDHFTQFLRYIKWAGVGDSRLRTNDQFFSLTDQLNMGVRSVELDTHWVEGELRIAHCGGLHVPILNKLVEGLNLVARLLHRPIRWDTETMGCSPSLSSIPVSEQRPLVDSMMEVRAWMDDPANQDEALLLYFDDQEDLAHWGVVGHLLEDILAAFPRDWIFTTDDRAAYGDGWPSLAQLLADGKRLLFVSGTDYGALMQPLVFSRGAMLCNWAEPGLRGVQGVPDCMVQPVGALQPSPLFGGQLVRVPTCELEYGPLNCDFVWHGSNAPFLDETTLPSLMGCGLNMPAPDLLTPARAAAAIWTWAPGQPYDAVEQQAGGQVACTVLSAADARWHAVPCSGTLPSACRLQNASLASAQGGWVLDPAGGRGMCPPGASFDLPRHPHENYLLAAALQGMGQDAAWLPVHAPDWSVDGWPAARQQPKPGARSQLPLAIPVFGGGLLLALAAAAVVVVVRGRSSALPLYEPLSS